MKLFKIVAVVLGMLAQGYNNIIASSLNGTASTVYASAHQVFYDGDAITGFVRINNGFTVAPAAKVLFDTFITVSGGIDLKETGILCLNNDLSLESGVTLTTGGCIAGRGHAVILGDNLTLTPTTNVRVLHIKSDTIIDGRGKILTIGDRAQIFVDTNVTLTLRDVVLKTGSFCQTPPIRLASLGSKLALDNSIVTLGSDFNFTQGQMFIHNDVMFTGTSAFVYKSPRPSYITGRGSLTFDKGITFSVAPATFTDCLFSNIPTTTTSNFLVMQDCSSTLFMNGSNLSTTCTGLRLTSGNLLFDNRVVIDAAAAVDLSTANPFTSVGTTGAGSTPISVNWSPSGRFLAVVNFSSNTLQVYRFNGTSAPTAVGAAISTGTGPYFVSWSPDGRFLAVVSFTSSTLQMYSFNGSSNPITVGSSVATGSGPVGVAWSPDGQYAAVVTNSANTLQIYRFNGTTTPTAVGSSASTDSGAYTVSWSSDGRFIVVGNNSANTIQVFTFNGNSAPTLVGSSVPAGGTTRGAFWSPDGRFIAVVTSSASQLRIFQFRGNASPTQVGSSVSTGSNPTFVAWSPDGRYVTVISFGTNSMQTYAFDGTNTPVAVGGSTATTGSLQGVAWSPNGKFVAVLGSNLQIFSANFTSPASSQAFSTGLVFGNSKVGPTANLNARFFGGAHVEVCGSVYDDSI